MNIFFSKMQNEGINCYGISKIKKHLKEFSKKMIDNIEKAENLKQRKHVL